jgi:hypothetical protein
MVCLSDDNTVVRATRIREGVESDNYICEKGHDFGLDYRNGPATSPQWPPPPELAAALKSTS